MSENIQIRKHEYTVTADYKLLNPTLSEVKIFLIIIWYNIH